MFLTPLIDYATRYCLAATITPTVRGMDALACLRLAVGEAERVLDLDDLRADRNELELVDEGTGEILHVVPAPISETTRFRDIYNRIRPHQAIGDRTPRTAYLSSS